MEELRNFKDLVKDHGYYNKESQNLILRGIDRNPEKSLNLDITKRAWIEIEMDRDNDESYQLYLEFLDKIDFSIFDKYSTEEGINSYKVFKDNKIKSGAKLFKFLKKKGILKPEDIEKVTTKRNTQQLWLCISQNPIDFLFCSSNQSFTSCLDIKSDYEEALYMGLLGLSADKNRFIAFSTKDKKGFKTELFNKEYKQYSIVSRCWGLLGKNKTFVLEKYYPFKTVGFAKSIEEYTELEYINKDRDSFYNWKSKYSTKRVKDVNDNFRWIYLDSVGIEIDYDNETFKYVECGNTGNNGSCEYNYAIGLEKLTDFKFLKEGAVVCDECGKLHVHDESRYVEGGNYCSDCTKDHVYCNCCHEYVKKEKLGTTLKNDDKVCDRCIKKYYTECPDCGDLSRKMELYHYNKKSICRSCYVKVMKKCKKCHDFINEDEYEKNDGYCQYCYRIIKRQGNRLPTGTKFRVKDHLSEEIMGNPGANRDMREYCGKVVTLIGYYSDDKDYVRIEEDMSRWTWDLRWFDIIEEEKEEGILEPVLSDDYFSQRMTWTTSYI